MSVKEKYITKDVGWFRTSLLQFSQNTTFHGVRYIGSSTSLSRRCMWAIFVLGCLAAVIIQIVDRVNYYYSWPVNVNVKINYNQTLKFPAVTLCNQNAFRATEAARLGRFRLIEDMYSKSHTVTEEDLAFHNATNMTVEDLFTSLAHRQEDLIVNCEWNKAQCSHKDFDLRLTDHGVCYTFSGDDADMHVSSSGVDAGLRLTLNVEQYEYMTGPHDAAGVKMLLHDSREMPIVHELGQAIPTGSHAFVGVKFMTIINLHEPYGTCDDKYLPHTTFYTTEECYSDCLVSLAAERCECRDMYMPYVDAWPPVCTLKQYYSCLQGLKEQFNLELREHCTCPVPCEFALFDPSMSYATISNHVVSKLLTDTETALLRQRYLQASEVTAKMDKVKFKNFQTMVQKLNVKFANLQTVTASILECLDIQSNNTEKVYSDLKEVYSEKERLYRFQIYAINKNFLRGREAMEERTLQTLVNAYAEFALIVKRRITRLASMNETKVSERDELYELIMDDLQVRQKIVNLARNNISVLVNAFINGTGIFNYKFEDTDRSHNPYIVPKPLLNESMHHNWYMLKYVPKMPRDFDLFDKVLEMFMNETDVAYSNGTINETRLNYVFERYQFACRTFMFSKSVVYSQGIDRPVAVITERKDDFDTTWNEFESDIDSLRQNIHSLGDKILDINQKVIPEFQKGFSLLRNYGLSYNDSLMHLADWFLSNTTHALEGALKNFFQEVQTRGQRISDLWSLLSKPTETIWDAVLNDIDALDYYKYTNNSKFLQNYTEVVFEWDTTFKAIKAIDIRTHISHSDEEFFLALEEITNHLQEFKDSIHIDSKFLKENFLQLDIFFRQLSYEQINQQKAYDFFSLICDIGGSMGLFIGASMLTIVEIIDLFLVQIPIFRHHKNVKS